MLLARSCRRRRLVIHHDRLAEVFLGDFGEFSKMRVGRAACGQGQMRTIGLEGKACAATRSGAASSTAATASLRIEFMHLLLDGDYSHPSDR